ncbi:ribonuclease H-like domain-containing protein [Schizophyllum amplum]|uniref:Ribonuclease H-like domain-containing protein n=1 Tax=Schizophyllum amplum TaxID=97359 RepID=A0A550CWF8_9AGAR|nr:ribonuclease H-like domain-containing protein [Auriculariopsis ampla]
MAPRPLAFDDGPIVWVDCEMTGLDFKKDKIIEIAVLITNGNLDIVDEGIEFVVRTEKSILDGMDEWCTNQHGKSGLTAACLTSPHTPAAVEAAVLDYVKAWVPTQRTAVLAGNSVHVDRVFLNNDMPSFVDWLHYRIIDVSSVKELARRWYPDLAIPKVAESSHRALDDIKGSIAELKWYRENIFKTAPKYRSPPPSPPRASDLDPY